MIYRVDTYYGDTPEYFNGRRQTMADYVYNYLSNHGIEGLTHTSGTLDIHFWGLFVLSLPQFYDGNPYFLGGTSITNSEGVVKTFLGNSRMDFNRPLRLTLISKNNFFYFSIRHRDSWGGFTIVKMQDSVGNIYAGGTSTAHAWDTTEIYASDVILYRLPDMIDVFKFTKPLSFSAPPTKIAYLNDYFLSDNNSIFQIPELHSCSTTAYRSTITILGHNFLALDTNTLLSLEEEN